jgi:small-conductance mechanosensitive channel
MNFPIQIDFIYDILPWISKHGIKVVAILIAAFLADLVLKSILTKKSLGLLVIEKHFKQRINGGPKKRIQTIVNVIGGSLAFFVYVTAFLMILPEFGVNIAPLLAGLGLVGLALGMAAKGVLTDFIAGFFILAEDQYNIGDLVVISGIEGRVKDITLRRTVLQTEDGTLHIIPNSEIKIVARKKHGASGGPNDNY